MILKDFCCIFNMLQMNLDWKENNTIKINLKGGFQHFKRLHFENGF
jgi:hypothetical protein